LVDEIGHAQDPVNVAGVIAEEDTTKGGERAHEIGFESDRCLDSIDIGRSCEHDSSTGHDGRVAEVVTGNDGIGDKPEVWWLSFDRAMKI
jgi:hypothetical protein